MLAAPVPSGRDGGGGACGMTATTVATVVPAEALVEVVAERLWRGWGATKFALPPYGAVWAQGTV